MKKILSIILAVTMLMSVSFSSFANELNDTYNSETKSIEVINISEGHEVVYYEGARIEDVTTEEYRKIITQSGTDISEYYEDFSTGMATLSVNGAVVETYNMNELREKYTTWQMPEEDAEIIEEYLLEQAGLETITLPSELQDKYVINYESDGTAVIMPLSNNSAYVVRAAENVVKPAGAVTTAYPEYTNKKVSTQSRYSASCGRYLDMSIQDSMYNYSQTSKQSYYYAAYTAVSLIAGALKIASSTLINSLIGLTTTVSGVLRLVSSIDYYFSESYTFHALRQAYIYDYSYNYHDVSVLTEYGTGEISMTWDYRNNEYTNPAYKITSLAYPHTISYTTMYDKAQSIWELNMEEYGYWQWGDV